MKILITGPESSGKTTIAKYLSKRFNAHLIEEYARTYLEKHGAKYDQSDILKIAKAYPPILESVQQNKYVVFDTYFLNLKIWSEEKFNDCHPFILEQLDALKFDAIFLMYPNTPWVKDDFRENPNDRMRLYEIFKSNLEEQSLNYAVIDQLGTERLGQAESIVGSLNDI